MRKVIKVFLIFVVGIMFVSCGQPKIDYKLEGTYISERLNYYEDGTLGERNITNIDIIKNGNEYIIKGNNLYEKIEVIRNYVTRTNTYGNWEEISSNSFTFKGKLVEIEKSKSYDNVPREELIFFTLKNKDGEKLLISIDKNVDVKELLEMAGRDYSDVKNIENYKKIDIIHSSGNDNLDIEAMEAFKM